eukprot:7490028-Pyramimonas_sp.AAC.1
MAASAAMQNADPSKRRRAKWLRLAHRHVDRLSVISDPARILGSGGSVLEFLEALWEHIRDVEGKTLAIRELFQLHNTY